MLQRHRKCAPGGVHRGAWPCLREQATQRSPLCRILWLLSWRDKKVTYTAPIPIPPFTNLNKPPIVSICLPNTLLIDYFIGKMTYYNSVMLLKTGGFPLVKRLPVCYNDIDKYYLIVCFHVCFCIYPSASAVGEIISFLFQQQRRNYYVL